MGFISLFFIFTMSLANAKELFFQNLSCQYRHDIESTSKLGKIIPNPYCMLYSFRKDGPQFKNPDLSVARAYQKNLKSQCDSLDMDHLRVNKDLYIKACEFPNLLTKLQNYSHQFTNILDPLGIKVFKDWIPEDLNLGNFEMESFWSGSSREDWIVNFMMTRRSLFLSLSSIRELFLRIGTNEGGKTEYYNSIAFGELYRYSSLGKYLAIYKNLICQDAKNKNFKGSICRRLKSLIHLFISSTMGKVELNVKGLITSLRGAYDHYKVKNTFQGYVGLKDSKDSVSTNQDLEQIFSAIEILDLLKNGHQASDLELRKKLLVAVKKMTRFGGFPEVLNKGDTSRDYDFALVLRAILAVEQIIELQELLSIPISISEEDKAEFDRWANTAALVIVEEETLGSITEAYNILDEFINRRRNPNENVD